MRERGMVHTFEVDESGVRRKFSKYKMLPGKRGQKTLITFSSPEMERGDWVIEHLFI